MDLIKDDHFQMSYIHNMQQEVYQFVIPDFYIGLSFKECFQMLYLYGLDLGDEEIHDN